MLDRSAQGRCLERGGAIRHRGSELLADAAALVRPLVHNVHDALGRLANGGGAFKARLRNCATLCNVGPCNVSLIILSSARVIFSTEAYQLDAIQQAELYLFSHWSLYTLTNAPQPVACAEYTARASQHTHAARRLTPLQNSSRHRHRIKWLSASSTSRIRVEKAVSASCPRPPSALVITRRWKSVSEASSGPVGLTYWKYRPTRLGPVHSLHQKRGKPIRRQVVTVFVRLSIDSEPWTLQVQTPNTPSKDVTKTPLSSAVWIARHHPHTPITSIFLSHTNEPRGENNSNDSITFVEP